MDYLAVNKPTTCLSKCNIRGIVAMFRLEIQIYFLAYPHCPDFYSSDAPAAQIQSQSVSCIIWSVIHNNKIKSRVIKVHQSSWAEFMLLPAIWRVMWLILLPQQATQADMLVIPGLRNPIWSPANKSVSIFQNPSWKLNQIWLLSNLHWALLCDKTACFILTFYCEELKTHLCTIHAV